MKKSMLAVMVLVVSSMGSQVLADCAAYPEAFQISYHASECKPMSGNVDNYTAYPYGLYWLGGSPEGFVCPISYPRSMSILNKCESGPVVRDRWYEPGVGGTAEVNISVVDNHPTQDFYCIVVGLDGTKLFGAHPFIFDFGATSPAGQSSGTGVQTINIDLTGELTAERTQYLALYCQIPPKPAQIATHVTAPSNPSGIAGYELVVEP